MQLPDHYQDVVDRFIAACQADERIVAAFLGGSWFLEDFGAPHGYFVFFSNGADCEIWFGRESKFHNIHGGPYRVLLDKKGILAGEVFPIHVADPAKQTEILRQQLDWFWHELSHFIKAMGRRQ